MTDQPKWTKGPWAAKWSKYEEDNFIVQAGMPSNRVLAQFDGDGDGPDDQSLANAHLIAAAPDMYAALEAIRDNEVVRAICPSPLWGKMADAMIKARGETK